MRKHNELVHNNRNKKTTLTLDSMCLAAELVSINLALIAPTANNRGPFTDILRQLHILS